MSTKTKKETIKEGVKVIRFWYPDKNADKEVVDQFIKESNEKLLPFVRDLIMMCIENISIDQVRSLFGLFLIAARGHFPVPEIKKEFVSSILENEEIKEYYKELLLLSHEPMWEEVAEEISKISELFKSAGKTIEEVKEEKTDIKIVDENTIIGKFKSFFTKKEKDNDDEDEDHETEESSLSFSDIKKALKK